MLIGVRDILLIGMRGSGTKSPISGWHHGLQSESSTIEKTLTSTGFGCCVSVKTVIKIFTKKKILSPCGSWRPLDVTKTMSEAMPEDKQASSTIENMIPRTLFQTSIMVEFAC